MAFRIRRSTITCLLLLGVATLTAAGPRPASAQVLSGVVASEDDGSPLQGAVVELLNQAGDGVAARLTGPDGAFSFQDVVTGRYAFRVGLLGYRTVTTEPFELAAGQNLHRRLAIPLEPIRLDGIRVSRGGRCGGDFGGTDLVRLWEEARKGLMAVVLTDAASLVSFRVAVYDRDLDPERGNVLREQVQTRRTWGNDPFRSAPAEELLARGFIRGDIRDTLTYYGPDAQLLLSEPFLQQYCFGIARGRDGEVGLTFEPEARIRGTAQIEGVLWIDAGTAALRRLEFTHTRSPVYGFVSGGSVAYKQLPNGAWIVREWRLRMGRPAIIDGLPSGRLAFIHETKGQVVEVLGLEGGSATLVSDDSLPELTRPQGGATGDGEAIFSTWIRERPRPRRFVLYMRNESASTVRVTAVTLSACRNVREPCGIVPMNVILQPGEAAAVVTVHARNASDAVHFDWIYHADVSGDDRQPLQPDPRATAINEVDRRFNRR